MPLIFSVRPVKTSSLCHRMRLFFFKASLGCVYVHEAITDREHTMTISCHLWLVSFLVDMHCCLPLWVSASLLQETAPPLYRKFSVLRSVSFDWQTFGMARTSGSAGLTDCCTQPPEWGTCRRRLGFFFFLTETSWFNCLMIICIISNMPPPPTHTHTYTGAEQEHGLYVQKQYICKCKSELSLC